MRQRFRSLYSSTIMVYPALRNSMAKLWPSTSRIMMCHFLHCSSSTRFMPMDSTPFHLSTQMYPMMATGKTGSHWMVYLMMSHILSDGTACHRVVSLHNHCPNYHLQ